MRITDVKKYLYFNYFRDPDPERRAEYLYCVRANLAHKFLDGYFIFLDNKDHGADIPPDDRMQFITLGRRMDFQDVIDHARQNLDDDSVVIIINLDVYLANASAWTAIDRDFFKVGYPRKAMVCTRHNLKAIPSADKIDLELEISNWRDGNFCDAWVLRTPLDPEFANEDFGFCVGNAPQCDNLMMGLMSKYYHTYSWGARYMIMHYDVCRQARYAQKISMNPKTMDMRASVRRDEHRNIPTQQSWQTLLESAQAPMVTYSWFDYSRAR